MREFLEHFFYALTTTFLIFIAGLGFITLVSFLK